LELFDTSNEETTLVVWVNSIGNGKTTYMFYVGIILERHYKEPGILTSQDDSWNVTYWML